MNRARARTHSAGCCNRPGIQRSLDNTAGEQITESFTPLRMKRKLKTPILDSVTRLGWVNPRDLRRRRAFFPRARIRSTRDASPVFLSKIGTPGFVSAQNRVVFTRSSPGIDVHDLVFFFRFLFALLRADRSESRQQCMYLSTYIAYIIYSIYNNLGSAVGVRQAGGGGTGKGWGGSKPGSGPGAGASPEANRGRGWAWKPGEGFPTNAPPPGNILMARSRRGSSWGTRDGGEFPRLRRLMAGDPRARGIEPDHSLEAIPGSFDGTPTRSPNPPSSITPSSAPAGFYNSPGVFFTP